MMKTSDEAPPGRPVGFGRLVFGALALALVIILVPPAFSIARDLIFLQRAESEYAKGVLAAQLYDAFETWDDRQHQSQPDSHPFSFPYLECPASQELALPEYSADKINFNSWSPDMGAYIIMSAFIAESQHRYRRAYIRNIIERYSPVEIIAMRSCIESSIASSSCAARVRDATWGSESREQFDNFYSLPVESDAMRAITYCRYYPAALAYHRARNQRR